MPKNLVITTFNDRFRKGYNFSIGHRSKEIQDVCTLLSPLLSRLRQHHGFQVYILCLTPLMWHTTLWSRRYDLKMGYRHSIIDYLVEIILTSQIRYRNASSDNKNSMMTYLQVLYLSVINANSLIRCPEFSRTITML